MSRSSCTFHVLHKEAVDRLRREIPVLHSILNKVCVLRQPFELLSSPSLLLDPLLVLMCRWKRLENARGVIPSRLRYALDRLRMCQSPFQLPDM
jgi:hypothetical protein